MVGFALAGGGTNWGLAQGLGGGRSDAFQAGVYGATRSGPAYLAAALAFANHWMSTDRIAFGGDQLTPASTAQSYGGRIEAGYRYRARRSLARHALCGAAGAELPHAELQRDRSTGGGFGLAYNAMTATDTRSELGARFDASDRAQSGGAAVAARAALAWAHDWVSNPALDARCSRRCPARASSSTARTPPKNSALASAGAELHFANWSLAGKFDGEFASQARRPTPAPGRCATLVAPRSSLAGTTACAGPRTRRSHDNRLVTELLPNSHSKTMRDDDC